MTAFDWILTLIMIKTFPAYLARFGTFRAYLVFEIILAFGALVIILYLRVPKTRKRNRKELEDKILMLFPPGSKSWEKRKQQ